MATVIRLARHGAKKHPYYHIVVTDSRNARNSGNILSVVGKYDPMQPRDAANRVVLKIEEIKTWMSKGAKPSDRVYKFLASAGVVEPKAYPVQTKKHLPSENTQMKIKDKQKKLDKIAEAKAAAEAAAAPVVEVEAPVVEAEVPAVEAEVPAVEVAAPAVEAEVPAVEAEAPAVEVEAPVAE